MSISNEGEKQLKVRFLILFSHVRKNITVAMSHDCTCRCLGDNGGSWEGEILTSRWLWGRGRLS